MGVMLWTPRLTHIKKSPRKSARSARGPGEAGFGDESILYPLRSKMRFPFAPRATIEYRPPSPHTSPDTFMNPKKAPTAKTPQGTASVEDLRAAAAQLELEAVEADKLAKDALTTPVLEMQLGLLALCKVDFIKRCLKEWDVKGRGEFMKAEFRINLRKSGLNPTSVECDSLFDSWDSDGGGSLDLNELKANLIKVCEKARAWRAKPDPNAKCAAQFRARAKLYLEAADAVQVADTQRLELQGLKEEQASSAAVRLGDLLGKRCIRPGAVVTQWSTSRGEHASELSKSDFREAVANLGLANSGVSTQDIDNVFDTFDEDKGGYLDAGEASTMIKELIMKARVAQQLYWKKERVVLAKQQRALAKQALTDSDKVLDINTHDEPRAISWSWLAPERRGSLVAEGVQERADHLKREKKVAAKLKREEEALKVKAHQLLDTSSGAHALPLPAELSPAPAAVTARLVETARRGMAEASAMLGLKQRPRSALWDAKAKKTAEVIARRMQHYDTAISWNTWVSHSAETKRLRQVFLHALHVLQRPTLSIGFRTWEHFHEERLRILSILKNAIINIRGGRSVAALATWKEYHDEQRYMQLQMQMAKESIARMKAPRLVEALRLWQWHAESLIILRDGKKPDYDAGNPCKALVRCARNAIPLATLTA